MTKLQTRTLSGLPLAWAVAQAEKEHVVFDGLDLRYPPGQFSEQAMYDPAWDPAIGNPIIERERIATEPGGHGWQATKGLFSDPSSVRFNGITLREAGLRCHVAHVLGDEVDIPDELGRLD